MSEAEQKQAAAAAETQTETKPSGALADAIAATKQTKPDAAEALIKTLVEEVNRGTVSIDKDVVRTINGGITAIDQVISKQLAAIMHESAFQKLEGSWRGLHYLVSQSETGEMLKIRVLNCSKNDLKKDLERAIEFDQSTIFKKLYENEFGMPGGTPYGAVIGDYQFGKSNDDINTLSRMSGVAAAAMAPFITAPTPELFGIDDWEEMAAIRDLSKIFESKEHIKWRSFRESEDSRYVTMAMPRVLARDPYGSQTKPIEEFEYEELPLGKKGEKIAVDHDQYCWMNASYVLGTKLTDAFAKYNWCTAIRGAENGGMVEGLPTHIFKNDEGDLDQKCPSEVAITDRREAELSHLGFLPLCHYKNTDYSVFFGAQSTQKPKKYDKPEATANASLSARLPYLLAASRIGHYLKVIARDKIGSFMERDECEKWLHNWIHQYVSADKTPDAKAKASHPLAEAQVEVTDDPSDPGSYNAVIHCRPWLQLESLTASIRMVAQLPKTKS
jgi:type VI secretion system protein ImpC